MIPVFEPEIGTEEIEAVVGALKRGEISGSFGDTLPEFENRFARYVGCKHGVAVSSGTTALHLAVAATDIGPGDEVLLSSSTNIATALAVYHHGATIVPVDSERKTWNLDLSQLEKLLTPKTRAILPVHLFGCPIDMDRLMSFARAHKLIVIEDCAESHGATWNGRMTGSFGDMSCFSFYANKIITTGEGGMVCTNDDALAEKLRLLRNLAFTKPRFRHQSAGFNFRMTGFQAAMGLAQLQKIERFIDGKRQMAAWYQKYLGDVPGLQLPQEPTGTRHVYWMYGILVDKSFGKSRDSLMAQLQANGVETRTFFCPMSDQPCFEDSSLLKKVACPVADDLWQRGLYLPSSPSLTEKNIQFISSVIQERSLKAAA